MNLDTLPIRASARITSIDWTAIPETEGHRLRSLGFDAGVTVGGLVHCDVCGRRMQGQWNHGKAYYRCKFAIAIACEPVA